MMEQMKSKMGHIKAAWNVDVMNNLVKAIEAKDPYTAGHVWRVSIYKADRLSVGVGKGADRLD
jgi:HD-GYP domain-containing protein (c-di-GMP phosphodiesterase class II)